MRTSHLVRRQRRRLTRPCLCGLLLSVTTPVRFSSHYTYTCLAPQGPEGRTGPPLRTATVSEATRHHPPRVMYVKELDLFAVTRMNNYLKRQNADAKAAFETRQEEQLFVTQLQVPVRVFVKHQLTNTTVPAAGYGATEKLSLISCCMHAEWCLDALSVPLFTSPERQRQRRLIAEREGRIVPLVGDPPKELSEVVLPLPVDSSRMPPSSVRGAHREQPMQGGSSGASGTRWSSSPPPPPRIGGGAAGRGRQKDYTQRFGADCFSHDVAADFAALQQTISQHHAQELGEIELQDIAVLTAEEAPSHAETAPPLHPTTPHRSKQPAAASSSSFPSVLTLQGNRAVRAFHSKNVTDETEAGAFQLVEVLDWYTEPDQPGALCLYDAQAPQRLQEVYARHLHVGAFTDCVTVHTSEEESTVLTADTELRREKQTWYTASAPVATCEGVVAVGKATSVERAQCLCAMHAESILQCLGVPLYTDSLRQLKYYEGCLQWGRIVAPSPVAAVTPEVRALFPQPLKEWYKPSHSRWRGSPLSVTEKLIALNRRVVDTTRLHYMGVDLADTAAYEEELLPLCVRCLAFFMRARKHPYEGAYMILRLDGNRDYRCSLYLPLPPAYGVRGGCAMATTPERAKRLAALHAVDVLCAVDYVPAACRAHPLWQQLMTLRASLRLLVPASWSRVEGDASPPDAATAASVRSPPSYREIRGRSRVIPPLNDVWRVMLLDANAFDVAPPLQVVDPATGLTDTTAELLTQTLPSLFRRCVRHLTSDPAYIATHLFHYSGAQHCGGVSRMAANNIWMRLPLPVETYGPRVAVGRCQFLKHAERHFYFHFFRIVRVLGVAPWDGAVPHAQLLADLYEGDERQLQRELSAWASLETTGILLPLSAPQLVAANKVPPCQRLSPSPVISSNLKKKMFTRPT